VEVIKEAITRKHLKMKFKPIREDMKIWNLHRGISKAIGLMSCKLFQVFKGWERTHRFNRSVIDNKNYPNKDMRILLLQSACMVCGNNLITIVM
jgi:hypothetical protein